MCGSIIDPQEVGTSKGNRRKESKSKCWEKKWEVSTRSFFPGGERMEADGANPRQPKRRHKKDTL